MLMMADTVPPVECYVWLSGVWLSGFFKQINGALGNWTSLQPQKSPQLNSSTLTNRQPMDRQARRAEWFFCTLLIVATASIIYFASAPTSIQTKSFPSIGSPNTFKINKLVEFKQHVALGESFSVQAQESIYSPNQENYFPFQENQFQLVSKEPLSTFSIDVDTASYSNSLPC